MTEEQKLEELVWNKYGFVTKIGAPVMPRPIENPLLLKINGAYPVGLSDEEKKGWDTLTLQGKKELEIRRKSPEGANAYALNKINGDIYGAVQYYRI